MRVLRPPPRQAEELGYLQRFVESVCFTVGLNYGLGFLSELFIFVSVAAASILCAPLAAATSRLRASTHLTPALLLPRRRYGANVDAFLSAMADAAGKQGAQSGRLGLSSVDAALEAASAVKVVEALSNIRELLRQQTAGEAGAPAAADAAADARQTYFNLAALLAVANGASSKKFDASEWSLTEAEAVRIARVFARCVRRGTLASAGRASDALHAGCAPPRSQVRRAGQPAGRAAVEAADGGAGAAAV